MESLFDWLATPHGIEFEHAVIGLMLALTAYVNWRTHSEVKQAQKSLDGHLQAHTGDNARSDQADER